MGKNSVQRRNNHGPYIPIKIQKGSKNNPVNPKEVSAVLNEVKKQAVASSSIHLNEPLEIIPVEDPAKILSGSAEQPVGDAFKKETETKPAKPTLEEKYTEAAGKYEKAEAECEAAKNEMLYQKKFFEEQKKTLEEAKKAKVEAAKKIKTAASKAKTPEEAGAMIKAAQAEYDIAVSKYKTAVGGYNRAAVAFNGILGQYSAALRNLRSVTKEVAKYDIQIAKNQAIDVKKLAQTKTATEAEKNAAKQAAERVKGIKKGYRGNLIGITEKLLDNWRLRDALPYSKGGAFSPKRICTGLWSAAGVLAIVAGYCIYKIIEESNKSNNNATSTSTETATPTQVTATETTESDVTTSTSVEAGTQQTTATVTDTEETTNTEVAVIDEEAEAAALAAEQQEMVYTVKKGDNLWNITKKELKEKNGTDPTNAQIIARVGEVMEKNGLHWEADHYVVLIYPGQKIRL